MGSSSAASSLYLKVDEVVGCMEKQPRGGDAELLHLTMCLAESVFSRCVGRPIQVEYCIWLSDRIEHKVCINRESSSSEDQLTSLKKLKSSDQLEGDFDPFESVKDLCLSASTAQQSLEKKKEIEISADHGSDNAAEESAANNKTEETVTPPVDDKHVIDSSPEVEIISAKRGRRARTKRPHEPSQEDEQQVVGKHPRKSSIAKTPAPVDNVKPQLITRSGRKVKAKILHESFTPVPRKKAVKPVQEEGRLCIALEQSTPAESNDSIKEDDKSSVSGEGQQFLCMYCNDATKIVQMGASRVREQAKPSSVFVTRKELCNHLESHVTVKKKLATMTCCLCKQECQSAVKLKRSLTYRILAHISSKHQLQFETSVIEDEPAVVEEDITEGNIVDVETEVEKFDDSISDESVADEGSQDAAIIDEKIEVPKMVEMKEEMVYFCMFCNNVNDMLFSLDDLTNPPFASRRAMRLHIEEEHTYIVGENHHIRCPLCQLEHRTTSTDLQQVVNRILRHLSETHNLVFQRKCLNSTAIQTCECPLCDISESKQTFASRSDFRKHLESKHVREHAAERGNEHLIECILCNAKFVTSVKDTRQIANRYVRHIQASHNFPEFKSRQSLTIERKVIKLEPDDTNKIRAEMKRTYPEGRYFCMYCNDAKLMVDALPTDSSQSFTTRSELGKHIVSEHTKQHEGKTCISCPLCEHERTTAHGNDPQMVDRMIRHAREIHKLKISDVAEDRGIIHADSVGNESPKKNKKGPTNAQYYCVFCNDILQMAVGFEQSSREPYETRAELLKHMQEEHVITSDTGSLVICPLCQGERHSIAGNTSIIIERLLRHITDTHLLKYFVIEGEEGDEEGIEAEMAENEEEEKEYTPVALPWRCLICMDNSPAISSMVELETHLKLMHINHFDSSGGMQCPQCDWKAVVANGKPRVMVNYFINHCIYTHQLLLRDNIYTVEESAEINKLVNSVDKSAEEEGEDVTREEVNEDAGASEAETMATNGVEKASDESVKYNDSMSGANDESSHVYMEAVECTDETDTVFNSQPNYTTSASEVTCEPSTVQQLLASLTEDKATEVDNMTGVEESEISKTVQQLVSAIEKSEPSEDLGEQEMTADALDERLRYCILCDRAKNLSSHQYQQHLTGEHFKDKGNKVQLKCPMCPQKFSRSKEYGQDCVLADYLINHMVRKHGCAIPTFMSVMRCGDCGFETLLKEKLRAHMIREHNAEHLRSPRISRPRSKTGKNQICDGCGMFLTKAGLKSHQQCCPGKVHPSSRTRDFKCENCSKSFFTKGTLNNHVLAVHMKIKRTLCASCGMAFFSRHDLEAHAWTRHKINLTGKPLAKCNICEFQTIRKLMCHHNYRHAPKIYKCRVCDHVSHNAVESRRHRQTHRSLSGEGDGGIKQESKGKTHTCPQCSKVFQGATNLRSHLAHTHGISRFQCHLCKHITLSERGLKDHIEKNHPNGEVVNINLCDICDKKFSSRCAYENHMYVKHKINISKREILACSICSFETLGHSLMRSHMRNHQTNTVRCSICSRQFPNQAAMSLHIQTDHQPKVQCQYCEYVTRTKNHLERHIARQHTHQKFACNHCAYSTHLEHRYKNHLRTVHSIGKEREIQVLSSLVQQEPEAVIVSDRVVPSKSSLATMPSVQHQSQPQEHQQDQQQQGPVKYISQVVATDAIHMDHSKVLQHHIIQQPAQQEIIYHTQHLDLGQLQMHHDPQQYQQQQHHPTQQQHQQQQQQAGEVDPTSSFQHTIQIISEAEAAAATNLQEQVVITTVTSEHEQQLLAGADLNDENLNVIYVTVPDATH